MPPDARRSPAPRPSPSVRLETAVSDVSNEQHKDLFSAEDELSSGSDVQISCADGRVFHLHSQIISAWSPILRDMLSVTDNSRTPASKKRKRELCFEVDDESSGWVGVLSFMYPVQPRFLLTWANMESVYRVADKYNMRAVLDMCADSMCCDDMKLSSDPAHPGYALRWANFACRYTLSGLKYKCLAHIKLNFLSFNGLLQVEFGEQPNELLQRLDPEILRELLSFALFVAQRRCGACSDWLLLAAQHNSSRDSLHRQPRLPASRTQRWVGGQAGHWLVESDDEDSSSSEEDEEDDEEEGQAGAPAAPAAAPAEESSSDDDESEDESESSEDDAPAAAAAIVLDDSSSSSSSSEDDDSSEDEGDSSSSEGDDSDDDLESD